ncbi:MAG: Bax inhibitor-1/YccA family protein [Fusobacteriota bacterium]
MFGISNEQKRYSSRMGSEVASEFLTKVFGWMFTALILTGMVMWKVINTRSLMNFVQSSSLFLIIMQFGIVLGLSFLINKISANMAKILFLTYALLTGLTFSLFVVFFDPMSVLLTLGITVSIFGVMAVYGYTTKEDLSKFRPLLMVSLIVLIIASFINAFLRLPGLYWIISYAGVFIFTALIGYDVNRIKAMAVQMSNGNTEVAEKYAIFGALKLYLDFINLFIYLLRIFGKRD